MKRILLNLSFLAALLIFTSGCYTLTRPPLSAIEADSSAAITYYHEEYHDNRVENYNFYDPYGYYSYSPYRWHLRYDWFTGNYYYDPYYYDYRYYNRDWYYYNNRYYWYRDGYWYYVPSAGSGSSGGNDSDKTPGRRTLSVPRAIGPSSHSTGSLPPPSENIRVSSGNATPVTSPPPATSGETKSYSTPKSSSGGSSSSSSEKQKETKTENSNNRRSSKPRR
ncbi:MAG: hypothetical protein DRP86_04360 [Candidatus Neomarinimicrobiota bacterium]|nr:hypothetical protein [Candidatus Neomarinimicrobiota bacterium]RKY49951.1 MAG: hypothetical protein DRP86_04360 [Candidatus Neomarinimicrobiota bacterium]